MRTSESADKVAGLVKGTSGDHVADHRSGDSARASGGQGATTALAHGAERGIADVGGGAPSAIVSYGNSLAVRPDCECGFVEVVEGERIVQLSCEIV
jgi:hypothetical protein